MKMKFRQFLILGCGFFLTSCAVMNTPALPESDKILPTKLISWNEMESVFKIGITTRAELLTALGTTKSIRFDSGYEIFVYQYKSKVPTSVSWIERLEYLGSGKGTLGNVELVILVDPSGLVTKTRSREQPQRR